MSKRFSVITNKTGCVLLLDTSKKEGQIGRVIAHFFNDETAPGKANLMANLCADHLEAEAARRAAKG